MSDGEVVMNRRRIAVITGAANGIGFATAARFLNEGDVVNGLDREAKEPMANGAYNFYECDVSDEDQVRNSIDEIYRKHGRIDVLVNVAGIVLVKPIEETRWEEFNKLVAVNLGGTFLLIKHVVPIMKVQSRGVIVNVSSVSAHVGQINHSLYGATKAGISALTRALAWELSGSGIRVNAVSPGSVDTNMLRSDVEGEAQRTGQQPKKLREEREAEQALQRWADPSEIASVIWFLSTDEASFVTGADLLADGGWTAK